MRRARRAVGPPPLRRAKRDKRRVFTTRLSCALALVGKTRSQCRSHSGGALGRPVGAILRLCAHTTHRSACCHAAMGASLTTLWDGIAADLTAALNGSCMHPPAASEAFGSPVAASTRGAAMRSVRRAVWLAAPTRSGAHYAWGPLRRAPRPETLLSCWRRSLPSQSPLAASPVAKQLRAALEDANVAVAEVKASGKVRTVLQYKGRAAHTRLGAVITLLAAQTPNRGEFSRLQHSIEELSKENMRLSLALVQAREEMRALADEQARSMADATALIGELTALLRRDLRAAEGPAVDAGECWPTAVSGSGRRAGPRPAPGSMQGLAADLHGAVHKAACVRRAVRFAATAAATQAQHAAAMPAMAAATTATPPSAKRAKKTTASPSPLAARVACSPLNMR